jgi:predicted short-subunit dehydrogenase-like oxidoreductase (DUF2520 family)
MGAPTPDAGNVATLAVGIIGAGAVGHALGRRLADHGWRVTIVGGRAVERARLAAASPLAVIAVPDDAVGAVAAAIADAGGWRRGQAVVHTSGALDASVLAPAAHAGALTGVLHPFQTLAAGAGADRLAGVYYGVEAAEPLLGLLQALVRRIGGTPVRIESGVKPIYHLAAVLASNATVALYDAAVELLAGAGLPRADAVRALLPLLRGTVDNLERLGVAGALTGPASRGDGGTVARHRHALRGRAPDLVAVYDALTRRMVRLARGEGRLNDAGARRILEAIGDGEDAPCR